MQYMLLIYEDESNPRPDDAEMAQWFEVTEAMKQAGVHVAGEALHPTSAATTVRMEGGEIVTTDGPFAETREQLGGYYLIDVDDLDAAIEWAGRMPNAHKGSIEVRPVLVFDED
ncbi:MAG: YciI family protein [Longimicrobiales bacterium]|nr:YciI family protein [Longimicrobiales bacterium]